jgi:hypothetical protein
MKVQHMKFGMLSAVLVVCTLMISTIDLSQNFVFAQNTTTTLLPSQLPALDSTSTPATPASGSNDESSSSLTTPALESSGSDDESLSSDANDGSNSNSDEISSSSGSADDANNSDDSGSQHDTSSSEDGTENNLEQTNPLLEQIRESVSGALSVNGIAVP